MSNPVFAFKLANSGSELSLGGLDPNVYSGTPTYTDVTLEGYWQINFDALTVDGSAVVGTTAAMVEPVRLLQSFNFLANMS
jgi:cathepsin D